jgi:hypothetical protein
VQHDLLFETLEHAGIPARSCSLLEQMYHLQKTKVRVGTKFTDWIPIKRGVRQGCVLSPLLYNIYAEEVIRQATEDAQEGIKVNGVTTNNLRYADDKVLIASTERDLQSLLDKTKEEGERRGLTINVKKTQVMCVTKQGVVPTMSIRCGNTLLKQVNSFCYLGKHFYSDNDQTAEIKRRIGQAKRKFTDMKRILCTTRINLRLRLRVLQCYVWSVMLYGCETWTLKKEARDRLMAAEMWFYRSMLKTRWTDRVSNNEVLARCGRQRTLVTTVIRRKTAYLGHIIRGDRYEIPVLMLQGKIPGSRGRGRPRRGWLDDIRDALGLTTRQIFDKCRERETWQTLVANIHQG